MSLYSQYATNQDKESTGATIEVGVNDDDNSVISFVVARMGGANKAYQKALEEATRPYRRQLQQGTLSEKISEDILKRVFCKTILKGWSNVRDQFNEVLPFNQDTAYKLMTELPELYRELSEQASDIALFRDEQLKEEAKN
ncbi:tail assembly chaperone [Klebsiella phage vB_KmiS-Kmi2C]|nr:tail assembly chaperone [Klebsiella phage vB_KmiS-Kmi2C]